MIERATGRADAREGAVGEGTDARGTDAAGTRGDGTALETAEARAIETRARVDPVEDVGKRELRVETARAETARVVAPTVKASAAGKSVEPVETKPAVKRVVFADEAPVTTRKSESDESIASPRHDEETLTELRQALSAVLPKASAPTKETPATGKREGSKNGREPSSKHDGKSKISVQSDELRRDAKKEMTTSDLNDSDEEVSEQTSADVARMMLLLRERENAAVFAKEVNRALPTLEEEPEVLEESVDFVTPSTNLRLTVPPRPPPAVAKEVSVENASAKESRASRWTAPKKSAYDEKLDKLLAVAERAGSTAERMKDEIANLEQRVDNLKPVPMQPWQEHGSSWAGDRKSVRTEERSERSSSAGTILNPKNKHSREVRQKVGYSSSNQGDGKGDSTPSTPDVSKVVTSVLRSDLLRSMGEMSAEEKLERLGLKSVPEDEGMSQEAKLVGAGRSASANRRVWHERASQARSTLSEEGEYGMMGFSPPPPSVRSQHRDTGEESPMNYVDKLKAQAKLARAESAKSWKAGKGVKSGIA